MPQDKLSLSDKLFSIEMAASTLIAVFLISGSWFSLSYASNENSEAISELKIVQDSAVEDISQIKTDVAVLLSRQEAADRLNEERLESIHDGLKDVRLLIQKLHLNNPDGR